MAESATLEIHFINVSQGDSILVLNRDLGAVRGLLGSAAPLKDIDLVPTAIGLGRSLQGTVRRAVLIDAGDAQFGDVVVDYLRKHGAIPATPGPAPALDVVIGHHHADHEDGLRTLFQEVLVTTTPTTAAPHKSGSAKRKTVAAGPAISTRARYVPDRFIVTKSSKADPPTRVWRELDALVTAAGSTRVSVWPGATVPSGLLGFSSAQFVIDLGVGVGGIPIRMLCVCADQHVYKASTRIGVPGKHPDQNGRSLCFVVEYGSFRCFLGSDIAGDGGIGGGNPAPTTVQRWFSSHPDIESSLGPRMAKLFPRSATVSANAPKFPVAGQCDVLKASHHASTSSNDTYFLAELRPKVIVIPSGIYKRFHRHPTQENLDRFTASTTSNWKVRGTTGTTPNTVSGLFITEIADRYKGTTFTRTLDATNTFIIGDIIVRPTDESVQAVQSAANFGQNLSIQVYGTSRFTPTGSSADRSLKAATGPNTNAPYPRGPWLFTSQH